MDELISLKTIAREMESGVVVLNGEEAFFGHMNTGMFA